MKNKPVKLKIDRGVIRWDYMGGRGYVKSRGDGASYVFWFRGGGGWYRGDFPVGETRSPDLRRARAKIMWGFYEPLHGSIKRLDRVHRFLTNIKVSQ